jgi:predicted phage replisome organizer
MTEVKWVKITTDMFDNRKIKHLRRLDNGDNLALIWVMLLTIAGRSNADGSLYLTEGMPYDAAMLSDELGFDEQTIDFALKTMVQLRMIIKEKGVFRIAGWEEYQNTDRLSEIRARDRERKKSKRSKEKTEGVSDDVQEMSAESPRNVREMSAECPRNVHGMSAECPHIEEEEEGEEEKEFHSFVHSPKTVEDNYVEKKVSESGYEGKDADSYREQLRENLKLKYLGGELGQYRIFISDEQFNDLCERLSIDEMEKYFSIVADCERAGKRYKKKSHYRAILEMATNDRALL